VDKDALDQDKATGTRRRPQSLYVALPTGYREVRMAEYIFLMHDDSVIEDDAWETYLQRLRRDGFFEGGSAIGDGVCLRKSGAPAALTRHLAGFIRVNAGSLDHAKSLLNGNPVFEAGGTVEIRELPRPD
jgi:hypothetical protein